MNGVTYAAAMLVADVDRTAILTIRKIDWDGAWLARLSCFVGDVMPGKSNLPGRFLSRWRSTTVAR